MPQQQRGGAERRKACGRPRSARSSAYGGDGDSKGCGDAEAKGGVRDDGRWCTAKANGDQGEGEGDDSSDDNDDSSDDNDDSNDDGSEDPVEGRAVLHPAHRRRLHLHCRIEVRVREQRKRTVLRRSVARGD